MVSAEGFEPSTHALKASPLNYKQQLARPAYSMHDPTKLMRRQQEIGLGARRVARNPAENVSTRLQAIRH